MSEICHQPTPVQTTVRNATPATIHDLLLHQEARALDIPVRAGSIGAFDGHLVISGMKKAVTREAELTDDGVIPAEEIDPNGTYLPTQICDNGLGTKLPIGVKYLATLRAETIPQGGYDTNVNLWLNHPKFADKTWLLRTFRPTNPNEAGIARAFLSNRYEVDMDHLDVFMAVLEGLAAVNLGPDNFVGCDLSESRMHLRVTDPRVRTLAPILLGGYSSPFDGANAARRAGGDVDHWRRIAAAEGLGYEKGKEPVIFAGFDVGNSETGQGAFTITPLMIVEICGNGLQIPLKALRIAHLGSPLEAGTFKWNADVQAKQLAVVKAKVSSAIETFLSEDFITEQVAEIELKAWKPIEMEKAHEVIEIVGKEMAYSEGQRRAILAHFFRGGTGNAGGVLNAVTSVAQTIKDPDVANEMERGGLKVLDLVSSII